MRLLADKGTGRRARDIVASFFAGHRQVCSSCSLPECGIQHVRSVTALSGGTNRLSEGFAAAYGLEDSAGKRWALKLADQVNDSYQESVLASQLAHRSLVWAMTSQLF